MLAAALAPPSTPQTAYIPNLVPASGMFDGMLSKA